jgi:hypothetical protein
VSSPDRTQRREEGASQNKRSTLQRSRLFWRINSVINTLGTRLTARADAGHGAVGVAAARQQAAEFLTFFVDQLGLAV